MVLSWVYLFTFSMIHLELILMIKMWEWFKSYFFPSYLVFQYHL